MGMSCVEELDGVAAARKRLLSTGILMRLEAREVDDHGKYGDWCHEAHDDGEGARARTLHGSRGPCRPR